METTPQDRQRWKEKEAAQRLTLRAETSLKELLRRFRMPLANWWEMSPVRLLDDPADDWRLLLQLFDRRTCFGVVTSTKAANRKQRQFPHGIGMERILYHAPATKLYLSSTFKPGSMSRSNENVVARRFLVVESDSLSKEDQSAIVFG